MPAAAVTAEPGGVGKEVGVDRRAALAWGMARMVLTDPDPLLVLPHRESSAETDREPQQLQNYWSEVRYMVRCIYRQAGTPLADDQDQSLVPDKEGVKELVDRYTCPPCHVLPLLPCLCSQGP